MSSFSDNFDLEQKVGALFFLGLEGPELDTATIALLNRVRPSGVCLFARNIKSLEQIRELTDGLRELCGPSLLISIDQEGGRVDRLRRVMEPMPSVAQLRTPADGARLANLTGEVLSLLGINMNFAPVIDVDGVGRDCSSNGLATRVFGQGPTDVIDFGKAYIKGLSSKGIKSCVKHFPGLGKCTVDSHEELPLVPSDDAELEAVDLAPYQAIPLDRELTAVMVGHAAYQNHSLQERNDEGGFVPSSIGGEFIRTLLRGRIGFDGVVVTDDLEMGAIMKEFGIDEACVMALIADNDQLLICNDSENIIKGFDGVIKAFGAGRLGINRLNESMTRLNFLKSTLVAPPAFDSARLHELSTEIKDFKEELG